MQQVAGVEPGPAARVSDGRSVATIADVEFPIRLQPALGPILLLFGVRPGSATVELDGGRLAARFGFFAAEAALANIATGTSPDRIAGGGRSGSDAPSERKTCPSAGAPTAAAGARPWPPSKSVNCHCPKRLSPCSTRH